MRNSIKGILYIMLGIVMIMSIMGIPVIAGIYGISFVFVAIPVVILNICGFLLIDYGSNLIL